MPRKNVNPTESKETDTNKEKKEKKIKTPKKSKKEVNESTQNIDENIQIEVTDLSMENKIENTELIKESNEETITTQNDINQENINENDEKPVFKKRGRKPKGGKIIQQVVPIANIKETKPNIILHLKCSLKDLQGNCLLNNSIESYNFTTNKNDYEIINKESNTVFQQKPNSTIYSIINNNPTSQSISSVNNYENDCESSSNTKEIWKKLKQLEHNLHVNNISDNKSACFWCTYDFDNPPIYIPKHFIKDTYNVYGCFCSPECAVAFLMDENIDSSTKFERYHLINHVYSKIYDYNKNIKPAPNPYYMLEKYYGNLSIQDYRSLFRKERLFLIVDKPLTRILPELHEDNDEFIINNKMIPNNTYQLKKKVQKKPLTKNNILNENFGIQASC